jgi:hypothetical protein
MNCKLLLKVLLSLNLSLLLLSFGNAQSTLGNKTGASVTTSVLPAPDLTYVCELKVTIGPPTTVGATAHGLRRLIPITGGTFEGPNLKGIVLPGGADYQFENDAQTRTEIEAIYTIQKDDGVNIHIRNTGLVVKTEEELEKLKAGEPLDWSKTYFRAAPKFEAPTDSPYGWMNNAIFVCRGVPNGAEGYVAIQVWKVE